VRPRQFIYLFLLLLLLLAGLGEYWWHARWREQSQDVPILAAAHRYGVEPALVKAVVWRESRFDPATHGGKGEIGLMQVLPKAAAKDWANAEHLPALPPEPSWARGTWKSC
jgi:soluble lytic murein transglycosylase